MNKTAVNKTMGVNHGDEGDESPTIWSGGIVPQILSCCKILSTRLLALQCRKMCFFCVYSRTFIVSPAMRPPRITVRSTPMNKTAQIMIKCRTWKGRPTLQGKNLRPNWHCSEHLRILITGIRTSLMTRAPSTSVLAFCAAQKFKTWLVKVSYLHTSATVLNFRRR